MVPEKSILNIKLVETFQKPITLQDIKDNQKLKNLRIIQRENRLSVMPVEKDEWDNILKMKN
ncbi:MAG: EVE domain-containing protein [Ignavibacteriaceae bacterium]